MDNIYDIPRFQCSECGCTKCQSKLMLNSINGEPYFAWFCANCGFTDEDYEMRERYEAMSKM